MEQTRPANEDLLTGLSVFNDFWGITSPAEEPSRTRIEIPVENFDPRKFNEIDLTELSAESQDHLF